MYFKINRRIFLHKSFIFLPFIIFASHNKEFYFFMLLFAFLHEMAHLTFAKLLHRSGESLFISPCGFELRIKSNAAGGEALILLSGPLLSLLFAAIFYVLGNNMLFFINSVLFIFNMLPAIPLDGGRLLKLMLWKRKGAYRGNIYIKLVSRFCAAIMIVFSVILHSIWLLVIGLMIFSKTKKLASTPFYKKRGKFVPVKAFYASESPYIIELLRLFSPYYYTTVYICGRKYPLTEADIIEYAEKNGCDGIFR